MLMKDFSIIISNGSTIEDEPDIMELVFQMDRLDVDWKEHISSKYALQVSVILLLNSLWLKEEVEP